MPSCVHGCKADGSTGHPCDALHLVTYFIDACSSPASTPACSCTEPCSPDSSRTRSTPRSPCLLHLCKSCLSGGACPTIPEAGHSSMAARADCSLIDYATHARGHTCMPSKPTASLHCNLTHVPSAPLMSISHGAAMHPLKCALTHNRVAAWHDDINGIGLGKTKAHPTVVPAVPALQPQQQHAVHYLQVPPGSPSRGARMPVGIVCSLLCSLHSCSLLVGAGDIGGICW
jgi:hypothetical protein